MSTVLDLIRNLEHLKYDKGAGIKVTCIKCPHYNDTACCLSLAEYLTDDYPYFCPLDDPDK